MANDFTWLLATHRVASQYGDGLRPEIVKLLNDLNVDLSGKIVALNTWSRSSGPAEQIATPAALAALNVVKFQQKPNSRTSSTKRG